MQSVTLRKHCNLLLNGVGSQSPTVVNCSIVPSDFLKRCISLSLGMQSSQQCQTIHFHFVSLSSSKKRKSRGEKKHFELKLYSFVLL